MNKPRLFSALFVAVAFAVPSISHAQPATLEATQTTPIQLRNVQSQFVGYWLDPVHQPKPIQIQNSEKNAGNWASLTSQMTRQPGNGNGPRDLKLPPDVEIVASIDPQNVLLVKGTEAGIKSLQKLLNKIDVPLGNVEIEAKIVELASARLQSLPLVFRDTASDDEKTPQLGDVKVGGGEALVYSTGSIFARTAFAAPISNMAPILQSLNEDFADGSAHIITAPRVTAIDGWAASLTSTERRALDLDETQQPESTENKAPTPFLPDALNNNWNLGLTFVESQTGFSVRPVLHGDLIAMDFQITIDNNVTQGSTIMRDGQTLAVRLPQDNPKTGNARVALVTARIIRRAGE